MGKDQAGSVSVSVRSWQQCAMEGRSIEQVGFKTFVEDRGGKGQGRRKERDKEEGVTHTTNTLNVAPPLFSICILELLNFLLIEFSPKTNSTSVSSIA